MSAIERLAVHLVTEQRLLLQKGRHIEGFVIIVSTLDFHVSRRCVCADELQEVADAGASEVANRVPTFNAHVTRVLHYLRKRLDLCQVELAGSLYEAFHRQTPTFKIDFWIDDVVPVVGEFCEGNYVGIFE